MNDSTGGDFLRKTVLVRRRFRKRAFGVTIIVAGIYAYAAFASIALVSESAGGETIVLFVLYLLIYAAVGLIVWLTRRRTHEWIMANDAITLLQLIEQQADKWDDLTFRAGLISRLVALAARVRATPRRLNAARIAQAQEPVVNAAVRKSAYVEWLAVWISKPDGTTRDDTLFELAKFSWHVVNGHWHELPERDAVLMPTSKRSIVMSTIAGVAVCGVLLVASVYVVIHFGDTGKAVAPLLALAVGVVINRLFGGPRAGSVEGKAAGD